MQKSLYPFYIPFFLINFTRREGQNAKVHSSRLFRNKSIQKKFVVFQTNLTVSEIYLQTTFENR